MADLAALRERSREAWDGADYAPLGQRLMPAARELVDACETLEKKGGLHPIDRQRVKTGTGY